jgi:hypothetical protein
MCGKIRNTEQRWNGRGRWEEQGIAYPKDEE